MADYGWDKPSELEGWFWLPDTEDRFYGRLTHDPQEGLKLHFYDVPGGDIGSRNPGIPIDSRLHGVLPGGLQITLDGVWPATWSQVGFASGTMIIDGFAQSALIGGHLDQGTDLTCDGLSATLFGLEATLNGAHGEPGLLNPQLGKDGERPAPGEWRRVDLTDGATLTLHSGERGSVGVEGTHSEVRAGFSIRAPAAMTAEALEASYLEAFREFVVFCTRRTSYVRTLRFTDGENFDFAKALRRPWPFPRRPLGHQYRLGLNLGRVSEPDEVIRRWFDLRVEVGAVWLLLFSTIGVTEGVLLENRFLNLMAFSEGYHRALRDSPPLTKSDAKAARKTIRDALADSPEKVRDLFEKRLSHANSQDQRERLVELANDAKAQLGNHWDFDPDEQCRRMVDTRNWMTHWGERTKHVSDDPNSLATFCRHLELIAYVAILRDLQLTDEEIVLAVGHGWVLDNLIQ